MVSLSRPLPDFGNPRAGKPRGNWRLLSCPKMRTYEIYKIYFNDGQYRTFGNFRDEYRKYSNLFYMMGNSRLKLTFMLNSWAAGKRMTRR